MTATAPAPASASAEGRTGDGGVTSGPTDGTPDAGASRHLDAATLAARRRALVVDVTAATAATILASFAFRSVFGGLRWLLIAAVAAVLATVLAAVSRQRRWSPLLTAAVGAAGLLLGGGLSVPDDAIAGFLPGPGTPGAILDGATRGWARILTTVPPVGTFDRLGAIVWATTFLATFVAVLLARGTRSAGAPALPSLVVLVVGILVGTAVAGSVLLSGTALMALLLVWITQRWRRRRETLRVAGSTRDHQRITAVAFVAGVVVVGGLLAPVLPGAHRRDRVVVRDETEPPFDPREHTSPLSEYPHWRDLALPAGADRPSQDPILTVEGLPDGVPLALATLDLYDGSAWVVGGSGADATGSSRFVRVGTDLDAAATKAPGASSPAPDAPTERVTVQVRNDGYTGSWVPLPAGATSLRFQGDRAGTLQRELRYNPTTGTAALTGALAVGDRYTASASVPKVAFTVGDARAKLVGAAEVDGSVVLPPVADPTDSLANRAAGLSAGSTAYAQAAAIERALTSKGTGYFSDGRGGDAPVITAGHTAAKLKAFLSQTGADGRQLYVGNAEKFAAAMAVIAREADLPARVVVGFRDDADDEARPERSGDTVTFTADQYDAWVEVAFEGVGWVAFFPTPPRSNGTPPPPETTEPEVKNAEVQPRPPIVPPPNLDALSQDQKKDKAKQREAVAGADRGLPAWLVTTLIGGGSVLGVVAVVVGGILGWKAWRRRRRRTKGGEVAQLSGAWREMADSLRDAGQPVARDGTRLEVASAIPPVEWDGAEGFAAQVDAAMFGPTDPDPAQVDAVWSEVDALRSHLRANRGRFGRLRLALNPRTLAAWR